MEASEHPVGTDVDLGENGATPDPFADIEPDPLADDLPPGVVPGELPGENPSEMPPEGEEVPEGEAVSDDPLLSPEDGEFLQEPDEERDASQDEEDEPVGEASASDEPEQAEEAEPLTPVEGSAVPETSQGEPEKPKRGSRRKGGSGKKKARARADSTQRGYVILRAGDEPGTWLEAFERPDGSKDDPFVLFQRNSTAALRKAYRLLSESDEEPQSYTLAAVPEKLWNPKPVAGRVHKQTAISVG